MLRREMFTRLGSFLGLGAAAAISPNLLKAEEKPFNIYDHEDEVFDKYWYMYKRRIQRLEEISNNITQIIQKNTNQVFSIEEILKLKI